MSQERGKVAVVGGGLAGLTAAWKLARAGASVTLYESRPEVGGRARTEVVEGCRIDPGAQLFGSMYHRALRLVSEVGLRDRLVQAPGRDALWKGGRAHEVVYGSVPSMLASGALPLGTKLRLGSTYLPFLTKHMGDLDLAHPERASFAGLDGETIAAWGGREMGRDFLEYLVYPQLASFYGAEPEETTAGFYHILARHGMNVSVHALRDGVGALAEALAARIAEAGGEVRTGSAVERVELHSGGARVAGAWGEAEYDGCVLATPAPTAARQLRGATEPLANWLAAVRYRPAVSLALVLERPLPVRWFGLSFPRDAGGVVSTLCAQRNKGMEGAAEGRGVAVAFAAPAAAPRLLEADSRAVLDAMLPGLVRAIPELGHGIVRARVHRWPEGYPLLPPGALGRVAAFRGGGIEGDARVAVAGDYLLTPTMEGAVTSGLEAADRLLGRLGTTGGRSPPLAPGA